MGRVVYLYWVKNNNTTQLKAKLQHGLTGIRITKIQNNVKYISPFPSHLKNKQLVSLYFYRVQNYILSPNLIY